MIHSLNFCGEIPYNAFLKIAVLDANTEAVNQILT